ncbi:MAG: UMP kinase [Actinobacteria bacterium]|nr:UMP kinase [Actinomycetota bacterium]
MEGDPPSPAFHRVLLKLSGQALGSESRAIDPATTKRVAGSIKVARGLDVDIAIVVGGGNIFRGMAAAAGGMDRATGDYIGMMATVQNALALQDALETEGVDTRVMSAIEIRAVCEPYILRRAIRHLEKGRVVICAAGTGNPYFSTDSAAALRALELEADAILMAKREYDGVYTADPEIEPGAEFIPELTHLEAIERGLKVMDTTALSLCMDNKMPIHVFKMTGDNIVRVLSGERVGTVVRTPAES